MPNICIQNNLVLTCIELVLHSCNFFSIMEKSLSIPILTPTHGILRPLGANIPTSSSYLPPPATDPTLSPLASRGGEFEFWWLLNFVWLSV